MSRDYRLYIGDVVLFCERVISYTAGIEFSEFVTNQQCFDAVMRNLELIGEASKNIPDDIRQQMPSIDWRGIIGMRNWIVHAYFGVKDEVIWNAIRVDVPELLAVVRAYQVQTGLTQS